MAQSKESSTSITVCHNPECRIQREIALDTILQAKSDSAWWQTQMALFAQEGTEADKALQDYVQSFNAHHAALRELVNLAQTDLGGRIYFRAEEAQKLMELAR